MRLSNKILLATLNRGKFEEFQALFSAYPEIELLSAEDILRNADKLKFAETHDTYLENAIAKARVANHGCHYPCLADDSGLEVMALEGRPGVRSQRFAEPKNGVTQDQANVEKLLGELKGQTKRNARFVCTLALVVEGVLIQASGTLEGSIAEQPRGDQGFGYDPVFIPKDSSKTLAEMTASEKNAISHRAKAIHELMAQLKKSGVLLAKP